MSNDILGKMGPTFDLSRTINLTSSVQAQFDESQRETRRMAEKAYNDRQKMQRAMEQTAENTGEANAQLQKIVAQQVEYIDLLKEQLALKKEQLELSEKQLAVLKEIFASSEDGVTVEKEIMSIIQSQIDSEHPLWEYVKDKGGDVAVAGILQWGPVIWSAVKAYLITKGISLP